MKRILWICCLVAASAITRAQVNRTQPANVKVTTFQSMSANVSQPIPISKNEFSSKVRELDKLIELNKLDEAKTKWKAIYTRMNFELNVIEDKVGVAKKEKNETDLAKYTLVMTGQGERYHEVILLKEQMTINKDKLNARLQEFAANIL